MMEKYTPKQLPDLMSRKNPYIPFMTETKDNNRGDNIRISKNGPE